MDQKQDQTLAIYLQTPCRRPADKLLVDKLSVSLHCDQPTDSLIHLTSPSTPSTPAASLGGVSSPTAISSQEDDSTSTNHHHSNHPSPFKSTEWIPFHSSCLCVLFVRAQSGPNGSSALALPFTALANLYVSG
mmetsp:Transcript_23444/g.28354  ORF Transcript_23444/g.28354 Transcript_23444/m.28354 type:complete len:133 (+) Transcript_23444:603-1001(+)